MATATILQLPQAIALTGAELVEGAQSVALSGGVQGYASIRITVGQIAALASKTASTGPVGVITAAPAAGANNDYTVSAQMGPAVGFVDLTPTAVCNITGLQAGFDGQLVIITNLSAFAMTLNALNAGSQGPNRFRMAADLILTQNDSQAFKYSVTISKWVAL